MPRGRPVAPRARGGRGWRAPIVVAALLALGSAACKKCGAQTEEDASVMAVEPPVPVPDGLIADLYVGSPNLTWQKLQRVVGGPAGILPTSIGGILATVAGLDPALGAEVDGASPAFGAIVGSPSDPHWALAFRLTDVRRARSALFDGETARFAPKESAGLTLLVGKYDGKTPPFPQALSRGGYLLVAPATADLEMLGPYVSRTLPQRPLPEGAITADLPRSSVQGILAPAATDAWSGLTTFLLAEDQRARADHGGRAPDFGDPKALVGAVDGLVQKRLTVLRDLDKARVELDVGDDGLSLFTTLTPQASGPARSWVDAMKVGDLAPLTKLPVGSAVALISRDGEDARAEQGASLEAALRASFSGKLEDASVSHVHDAIAQLTAARDEVLTGAMLWDEPRGLVLQGPVRDAKAADGAVRALLDLARAAPFKEMLGVRDLSVERATADPWGALGKARLTRTPVKAAPRAGGAAVPDASNEPLSLVWTSEAQPFTLATAAGDALPNLRVAAAPQGRLGDEPEVVRALVPLASDASTVVLFQPLRFDTNRANLPAAPAMIAVGRRAGAGFVRVSLTPGVLREISRRTLGF